MPYGRFARAFFLALVLGYLGTYSSAEAQVTRTVIVTWEWIRRDIVMVPIVNEISSDQSAAVIDITIENIRPRWYVVRIGSVGPKIRESVKSLPNRFILAPSKSFALGNLTFGPREGLFLTADGTANNPIILFFIAADFVTRTALGESFADIIDPTNAANACFGIGVNWNRISLCRTLVNIGQDIAQISRGSIRTLPELLLDITAFAKSEELRLAFQAAFGRELPAGLGWLANIYEVLELTIGTLLSPESDVLMFRASATAITRPNQPPVIQKIKAQPSVVRPGGTSTISVAASDPEGDPLAYTWSVTGGTLSSISGPEDKIWTAPNRLGVYEIRVNITDNQPGRKPISTSVRIQVVAPLNRPPIANAGPDQAIQIGSTVQLDGSGSSDPDGDPLTFYWRFISKPGGSRARLSNSRIPNPVFIADKEGEYVLELRVQDNKRAISSDQVKITATQRNTFSISGRVTLNGVGFSQVGIEISGPTLPDCPCLLVNLDADGNYSFRGLPPGIYTLLPISEGYTFDPPSRIVTITNSDITGQDFVAIPIKSQTIGNKMKFVIDSQAIKDLQLQIFDLSGRTVFITDWLEGNIFEWHLNNNKGEVLANGVYLYVITVRGWDGTISRSEVKKLVILR